MRTKFQSGALTVLLALVFSAHAQTPPPTPAGKPPVQAVTTEATSAAATTTPPPVPPADEPVAPTAPPTQPTAPMVKKPAPVKPAASPVPSAPTPVENTATSEVSEPPVPLTPAAKKAKDMRRLKRMLAIFEIEIDGKPVGTFKAQLYPDKAPKTVENFSELVEGKKQFREYDETKGKVNSLTARPFYDGLTFHRIVANYVIQGGCPLGTGRGNTGETIVDEINKDLRHVPGALAMASSGGKKDSNSSQFYITLKELKHLDGKYTIFGRVIEGMDVVNKIGEVKSDRMTQLPIQPVIMKTVKIVREYQN